jgi:hypothetical protein
MTAAIQIAIRRSCASDDQIKSLIAVPSRAAMNQQRPEPDDDSGDTDRDPAQLRIRRPDQITHCSAFSRRNESTTSSTG